jgi:mono/diheme cytochrome c family protein
LCLALLVVCCLSAAALAESGKELFEQQCAGCHTIGGGDGAGPDLKGVGAKHPKEWLVRMIAEPDKLAAEHDQAQQELVKKYGSEMPNLGVSKEDAGKLATFLQEGSGADAAAQPAAAPGPAPSAAPASKELLAAGSALFTGKTPFTNGGPPCVACHALRYPGIYGGALAADLTGAWGKMGDNGVRGVLKGLNFPVMKKAYAERPLTDQEREALTALFQDASQRQPKADDSYPYPAAGLGFFALALIGAAVYHRRIN